MPRWEPGSRERLQQAALDLYSEQGFEHTTVGDVAGRAGVDKRTFFRHFADKREVLFAGAEQFQALLAEAIVEASPELGPLEAVTAALASFDWQAIGPLDVMRRRQAVIDASTELTERELTKLDALTSTFADALRRRGVDGQTARLAARAGMTVFRTSFERLLDDKNDKDMAHIVYEVLAGLRAAVRPDVDHRGISES